MIRWIIGGAVGGLLIFAIFLVFILSPSRPEVERRIYWAEYFHYHYILRVSDYPLFNAGGGVNQNVLDSLIAILNEPRLDPMLREPMTHWPTGMPFEGIPHTVVTAADFSCFVVSEPESMSHSGAVIIKLFETIPGMYGVEHGHITEFTSQWWQLVYRATDGENDVLTLWMLQPYRLTPFNGTRYGIRHGRNDERFVTLGEPHIWEVIPDNSVNTIRSDRSIADGLPACDTYFFESNFSTSIVRSNLLRDMLNLVNMFDITQYLVAPRDVPGQWQSSYFQTGTNAHMHFYVSGGFQYYGQYFTGSYSPIDGLGASGLIWGNHLHFNIGNGKDGLSVGPYYNDWPNTVIMPTYNDLLWLPSDFETRSMGHDRDNAHFQTFIAEPENPYSRLRWNYIIREEDSRQDLSNGRSGLWQLNGYDRAFYVYAGTDNGFASRLTWLRTADSLAIGNANTIYHTGNRYSHGVNQLAGMRPAVHISIAQLRLVAEY